MKALAPTALLSLRFGDDAQEQRFLRWEQAARLQHYVLTGWLALATYNMFMTVDWMVGRDVFEIGVKARLGLCTTLSLAILLCARVRRAWMLSWHPMVLEWVIALPGFMAALSVAIVATSPALHGSPWSVFYHAGFVPIILYGTVVQRLRFQVACPLTGAIWVVHAIALVITPPVPGSPVIPIVLFMLAISLYTLMLNLRLEQQERLRFQQQQRAQAVRAELDESHRQLEMAALSDPLTNVANRRGLERYIDEHWPATRPGALPFALLLIDVDHFKAFNDGHGHPAGDVCLRHVARALQQSLHGTGKQGLLARWGGEEFVVALPATDDGAAMHIAHGLLHGVASAAIRHGHSPISAVVTVSIGVASSQTLPTDLAWSGLLARADLALYQAKQQGRNRAAFLSSA
jgi:diguanylate cyclase (GGDEF)-like protein